MEESSSKVEKEEPSHKQFLSKFNKPPAEESSDEGISGKRKHNDDGWGGGGRGNYFKIKNGKLKEQNKEFELKSTIFKGISIYVNGYTSPSSDTLKQLICEHGGQYIHYFSKTHVSHVIATNLPDGKIKNLKWNDRVVHPNWIVDSVEKMKLLPEDKYLIFSVAKREGNVIKFGKKEKTVEEGKGTNVEGHSTAGPELVQVDNSDVMDTSDPNKDNDYESMNEENDVEVDMEIESAHVPQLTSHSYTKPTGESKPMLKAGDKNYIEEYYAHSRLHHLSMWKAELKKFASSIKEKWKGKQGGSKENQKQKYIMHVDLDSFFASVALKLNPELRGKPIAVCHSKGDKPSDSESWSEIASCNYEARNFGLRNGMLLKDAKRSCPELICVPYNFEEYRRVSQKFYEVISKYTYEVQAVSCDEVLLDASNLIHSDEDILQFAENIRSEIFEATQCTASCGIGNSILIAKLATKHAKPDGIHYVRESFNSEFILTQEVKDLPGVGRNMRSKLDALGIKTCGDMQKFSLHVLQNEFGKKFGETLYGYARGMDKRKVKIDNEVKSVSAEINYGMRFTKIEEVEKFVLDLSSEVEKRLKENNAKGKLITLKLMIAKKAAPNPAKYMGHGICDSLSKSCTLPFVTNDPKIISESCIKILRNLNIAPNDYRGIGIQVSKLLDTTNNASNSSSVDLFKFAKPVSQQDLFKEIEKPNANPDSDKSISNKNAVAIRKQQQSENQICSFGNQNEGEWDQSVLDALPEDIRNELLQNRLTTQRTAAQQNAAQQHAQQIAAQQNSAQQNAANKKVNLVREKEKTGSSSKKSPKGKGKEKKTKNSIKTKFKIDEHMKNQRNMGNLSSTSDIFSSVPALDDIKSILPSHIDPTTFDALPDDIKLEILNDANLKKKYDDMKTKGIVPNLDIRDISRGDEHSSTTTMSLSNQVAQTVTHVVDQITIDDSPSLPPQQHNTTISTLKLDEKNSKLKQKYPEFCGIQDPNEIKNTLRKWINEFESPLDGDIQALTDYFHQLLTSYNMESLHSFMLFFKRNLSPRISWHYSFNVILDFVQKEMKIKYGGTFPISPFEID